MKKINVIGTSGSGKSTFSKKLAAQLGYPYLEMDAIFWGKNWQKPNDDEFFQKLQKHLEVDHWVLDGNYSRTTSIKWAAVDTVIWIDSSFPRTLFQACQRAISRLITQEELWHDTGNRESFRKLFSRDSIVLWTLKNFYKNRKRYSALPHVLAGKNIDFIRLRTPGECRDYLNKLPKPQ